MTSAPADAASPPVIHHADIDVTIDVSSKKQEVNEPARSGDETEPSKSAQSSDVDRATAKASAIRVEGYADTAKRSADAAEGSANTAEDSVDTAEGGADTMQAAAATTGDSSLTNRLTAKVNIVCALWRHLAVNTRTAASIPTAMQPVLTPPYAWLTGNCSFC